MNNKQANIIYITLEDLFESYETSKILIGRLIVFFFCFVFFLFFSCFFFLFCFFFYGLPVVFVQCGDPRKSPRTFI